MIKWRPRPELNWDTRFRKPLLYPFELRGHRWLPRIWLQDESSTRFHRACISHEYGLLASLFAMVFEPGYGPWQVRFPVRAKKRRVCSVESGFPVGSFAKIATQGFNLLQPRL